MTQAFNLAQLANNLNTSGQLDATDGLTGAVPIANGGTGTTSTTYCNLGTNVTGTLPIARGGTGATTASTALANLGGINTTSQTVAKAWVNFAGSVINASYNVSSVTQNADGDYTVNFTNSFSDAYYSIAGMCQRTQTNDVSGAITAIKPNSSGSNLSTSSARISTSNDGGGASTNTINICIVCFR